jgi:glycosyltransferase involved in cell wall biosynthesis
VRRLRADIPLLSRWLRPGRFRSEIFGIKTLLWLLLHGWRTQIIHAHAQSDALYTAWLFTRLRRAPLIFEMTLLGTDDPGSFAANSHRFARLRNALFRRCDGFVAISPALARAYEAAGLPPSKLRLIPQGVDAERFRPAHDKGALRHALDLPTDGPLIVFVGSLIERKGIDVLLDAWSRIHARFADATLALVGRDTFDDNAAASDFLRAQLERLPAEAKRRVVRAGVQDAVERWLAAADVFAFPSRREGFGTAMIEAMACALPCVVAELPDITDFIFDEAGASGIVVPQDDPEAMAARVGELLADAPRRTAIGAAARRRAVERFAIERIADDYLAFYAHLAQPAGA